MKRSSLAQCAGIIVSTNKSVKELGADVLFAAHRQCARDANCLKTDDGKPSPVLTSNSAALFYRALTHAYRCTEMAMPLLFGKWPAGRRGTDAKGSS